MLYVLAGLCYHNCVLLYVPCTLCKKPRCIREYNCFSLLINRLWAQYLQPLKDKMTTTRDVSNIAKFNGQNLPTWKLGCWILFQQHGLVKIVTGEEKLPVEVPYAMRSTHSNR